MSDFLQIMSIVYDFFNMPMNIYGFEFSLWHVMIFGLFTSVVIGFVGRLINDD